MRNWAWITLRETQITLQQGESTRDRVETSGDSTCTCNNNHGRTSNNICTNIGTNGNHEQTDSGRAEISD